MDVQKLTILNKKIIEAIDCISRLRRENDQLHKENRQLTEQNDLKSATIEELHGELDSYGENFGEIEQTLNQSLEALVKLENALEPTNSENANSDVEPELENSASEALESTEFSTENEDSAQSDHTQKTDQENSDVKDNDLAAAVIDAAPAHDEPNTIVNGSFHTETEEAPKQVDTSTDDFLDAYTPSSNAANSSDQTDVATPVAMAAPSGVQNNNEFIDMINNKSNATKEESLSPEKIAQAKEFPSESHLPLQEQEIKPQTTSLWDVTFNNAAPVNSESSAKRETDRQDSFSLFDFPSSSQ